MNQKNRLRLNLESKSHFSLTPYALTTLPKPSLKKEKGLHYPKGGEIKTPIKTTRTQIERHYTLIEGNFNLEGTWQCDFVPEYSGALFIQIIFVKRDENIKAEFEIISNFYLFKKKNYFFFRMR